MPELLRAVPFVLACCIVLPLAAQGDASEIGREREAGVLAVLRGLDPLEKGWLASSSFLVAPSPLGGTQVLPQIPISCGNSRMGVFDAARARRMARELFAVYRLDAKADVPFRGGVDAVLDGCCAARKVGFELRGVMPAQQTMAATAGPESREAALDDGELAKLRDAGYRLHVADLKDYPLMDNDQYTPTLAYLASVVAFLDEVTDGRDVALDAVLWQRRQRFPFGPVPLGNGGALRDLGAGPQLIEVARATTMTLAIDGSGCEEFTGGEGRATQWAALAQPIPTAGHVTRVTAGVGTGVKGTSMRITQHLDKGPAVDVEAAGTSVLMPSEFDAGQPFTIVLKLEPGTYYFDAHVVVGCPRR